MKISIEFVLDSYVGLVVSTCFFVSCFCSQNISPSFGCRNRRLASEHISARMLCKACSMPLLRFQFLRTGTFLGLTTPVLLSTQPMLILERNLIDGGTAG